MNPLIMHMCITAMATYHPLPPPPPPPPHPKTDVALDDHVLTNTQFDLASQEGGSSQVGGASQQTVDFLFPSEDRLWYLSTSQDERRGAGSPDSRGTTPSPLAKHRGSSPHHHHYKPHGGPARLRPQKRVRFKAEDIILDAAIEGQLDVLQECVREVGHPYNNH